MPRLAFFTFGLLREPHGHPQVQAFYDMSAATGQAAKECDGVISFLRGYITVDPDRDDPDKQPYLYPRAVPNADCRAPQARTLSLWRDLEAVHAYAYHGIHAEALRLRKEWFVKPQWPSYVAWWVADDDEPTWEEAVARLDYLHEHGPTPHAFSFKTPFNVEGSPTALRRPVQASQDHTP
jgi:Domain of unknown function (DUF3291)